MKLWIDYQAREKQWVIKTTHILEYSTDRVDFSFVDIILFIKLEFLLEIYSDSWTFIRICSEIFVLRSLEKIIALFLVKQAKPIIIELNHIFFEKALVNYRTTRLETHIHIIQEIVDRFLIICHVKIGTYYYLLDCYFLKPSIKFIIRSTDGFVTPHKLQLNKGILGRMPVTLNCKVMPIWALIIINTKFFHFRSIWIMKILACLTIRKRYLVLKVLPVTCTIGLILPYLYGSLV